MDEFMREDLKTVNRVLRSGDGLEIYRLNLQSDFANRELANLLAAQQNTRRGRLTYNALLQTLWDRIEEQLHNISRDDLPTEETSWDLQNNDGDSQNNDTVTNGTPDHFIPFNNNDLNRQYNMIEQRWDTLRTHMNDFDRNRDINADTPLFPSMYNNLEYEFGIFHQQLINAIIDLEEKIATLRNTNIDNDASHELSENLQNLLAWYNRIRSDYDDVFARLIERIYTLTPKLITSPESPKRIQWPISLDDPEVPIVPVEIMEDIIFDTKFIDDPSLPQWTLIIEQQWELWQKKIINNPDGTIQEEIIKLPKDKIVRRGTREVWVETQEEPYQIRASITDTHDIHLQTARLNAEERLRNEYNNTSRWNIFRKAGLWLSRRNRRRRMIQEEMDNVHDDVFTRDHRDVELTSASDRHELEDNKNLNRSDKTADYAFNIPQINELCRNYIRWYVTQDQFQQEFNEIVRNNTDIQNALHLWDMRHISSNILYKLDQERDMMQFVQDISTMQFDNLTQIRQKINRAMLQWYMTQELWNESLRLIDNWDTEQLSLLFRQQKVIRQNMINNLEIRLWVLANSRSAYSIDNTDREDSLIYRGGHTLDRIPWRLKVTWFAGLSLGAWLLGGPLWLWIVWSSALATWVSSTLVWVSNFFKKWSHYTKEQNTHEKNLTTDNQATTRKIQQWQHDSNLRGIGNRFRRYRARRQLELYNEATQVNIVPINHLIAWLETFDDVTTPLTQHQRDMLETLLIEATARLRAYYQLWHNFLYSENRNNVEQDVRRLHQAIDFWTARLGISSEDIDTLGSQDFNVNTKVDMLTNDYDNATRIFNRRRTGLSWKYGISTAALSAAISTGAQRLWGGGMFSEPSSVVNNTHVAHKDVLDYFGLGSYDTWANSDIYATTKNIFSSLPDGSHIDIDYAAGTDLTSVTSGSKLNVLSTYTDKVNEVIHNISSMSWLTWSQKSAFIHEIGTKNWESLRLSKWFTNDNLHGMRVLETLENVARALNDSWNHSIQIGSLTYEPSMDIVGTATHELTDRIGFVGMDISNTVSEIVPWHGRSMYIPIPIFANTFTHDDNQDHDRRMQHNDEYTAR